MEIMPFMIESQTIDKVSDFKNVQTISNLPVKVDKVLYDLSGLTPIGVSGVITVRGIRLRGTWDIMGNILEFKKMFSLNVKYRSIDLSDIFNGYEKDLFRLVKAEPINQIGQ